MWLAFAVPVSCFAAWQLFLRLRWGAFPIESGKGSTGLPLSAVSKQLWADLGSGTLSGLRRSLEIVLVLVFLAWALGQVRRGSLRPYESLALIVYGALAIVLARDVWSEDWGFLRVLSEAVALAVLVVVSRPGRHLRILVSGGAALWLLFLPSLL
jgi:hypothetical protein